MQQLILNFQNDMEATGGMMTSSSPVASRNFANPLASPENNSVPKTPGTSGRTCLEQFGNHARAGLWAKTLAGLLIGQTGWFSSRCALIWKLKGTKYNRLYFQLAVSTPRTDETASGLLATPNTMDMLPPKSEEMTTNHPSRPGRTKSGNLREQIAYNQVLLRTPAANEPGVSVERLVTKEGEPAKIGERAYDKHTGRLAQVGLIQQVQMLPTPQTQGLKVCDEKGKTRFMNLSLLPTPTVMDTNTGNLEKIDQRRARAMESKINGNGFGMTIGELANRNLLPTPTASNGGSNFNSDAVTERGHGKNLVGVVKNSLTPLPESDYPEHWKPMEGETSEQYWERVNRQDRELGYVPKMGFLPTPAAQDGKNGTLPPSQIQRDTVPGWILSNLETGRTSQLNPRFVAEMMNFPPDWLELPFQSTETKA